ncbi:MAG: hypothetical protein AB7I50_17965 [Vicinamibacterales bacterium]
MSQIPMRFHAPARWASALVLVLATAGGEPRAQTGTTASQILETVQLKPNLHVIFGAGGNITVQTGTDGVIVVNSGTTEMADKVLAEIKAISELPIRAIINTSADVHNVGGNAVLAAAGAAFVNNAQLTGTQQGDVLAREEVLLRLSAPTGEESPVGVSLWPTETYTQRIKSMYVNGEAVQVMHMPKAHSDGDSVVFFRRADVIAVGDIIDLRSFPVIDLEKGGSVAGEIAALNRLLDIAVPPVPLVYKDDRTLLVPARGRILDHAELVDYRDMITTVRDIVAAMIEKGMTLPQVQAANPTAGFRARYGADTGPWTTEKFVEAVYNDLKKAS